MLDLRNARRSLDVDARIRTLSAITILIGTLPDPQLHRMISRLTVLLEELRVSTKNCQLAKQRPVRGAELDPTRRKVEVRMGHPIWAGSAAETRRIRSVPRIGGVPKRNETCTIWICAFCSVVARSARPI